jgi:hypothetical protein
MLNRSGDSVLPTMHEDKKVRYSAVWKSNMLRQDRPKRLVSSQALMFKKQSDEKNTNGSPTQ